ncbi:Ger(x)C family spore germination protein [Paenibacillus piri]|uniref:Ger(X)C family spore germination protein n=1 Tax=Paenibacillus piri TaxID=2547395 RepID=A0A4R5KRJ7_9BACL|nr:Ger(x)C family spore germination protein [Paenibacillus piri]TDF97605.1 Ger(x)C family spore germination protein [Paenibacillus piri]
MTKVARAVLILASVTLLLSGCWNASEIDNLEYVNAIGIDYSKDNKEYTVYLQLLSIQKVAKTESEKLEGEMPAWIGVGKGKSYVEAIGKITLESQKRLFWGHVTALVLGEGLLEKGEITDVLQAFFRFHELRYTMWVFGSRSDLSRVFEATPNFERSRLKMLIHSPLENYKQRSYIAPLHLNDFMAGYYEPAQTLILPAMTVSNDVWRKSSESLDTLKYSGVYPFTHQQSNGFISMDKIDGIRWVQNSTTRASVSIMDGTKALASLRLRKPRHSIKFKEVDGKLVFDLKVKVNAVISEMNEQVSEQELEKQVQKVIEKELRETFEAGLKKKVDLLGLQNRLYSRHVKKFRQYDKDQDQFILQRDSLGKVDVKVNLTSAGKYTYRMYKDNEHKGNEHNGKEQKGNEQKGDGQKES